MLERKGWRYRTEKEVRNKRERDELLLGIRRMRVTVEMWVQHAPPPTQNGEKMDLLEPVIHQ